MSASKSRADEILHTLQQVADARSRPMMGGWLVYVDEVLIGQINEGELFIKISSFTQRFAPTLEHRPPYEGAKPALVIPGNLLHDEHWVHELLAGSVTALRRPPAGR